MERAFSPPEFKKLYPSTRSVSLIARARSVARTEKRVTRRKFVRRKGQATEKVSIAKYGNLTPSGLNFCELAVQHEEDRWPLRLVALSSSVSRVSR